MTYLAKLQDLASKLEQTLDAKYKDDAQGTAAITRQLRSLWAEIDELEARDAQTLENTPEPEYTQLLTRAAEDWPDHHLEAIVGVYERRHNVQRLRVIDGGGGG